jgi:hypothetical protein
MDQMAVGDLSARHGNLTGPAVDKDMSDAGLDLWGPRSVLGHAASLTWGNSQTACANVKAKSPIGGQLVTAQAVFTGDVVGTILLVSVAKQRSSSFLPLLDDVIDVTV